MLEYPTGSAVGTFGQKHASSPRLIEEAHLDKLRQHRSLDPHGPRKGGTGPAVCEPSRGQWGDSSSDPAQNGTQTSGPLSRAQGPNRVSKLALV